MVGIEKLNLYTSRLCTDAVVLAQRRGRKLEDIQRQVMVGQRAVIPVWEDAVLRASRANAASRFSNGPGQCMSSSST